MKTRNYFKTWKLAFAFMSALSPQRQEGCELRRSGSRNPDRAWVVIENPAYQDEKESANEPPLVY